MVLERLAKQWIAGIAMKDALERAKVENEHGVKAIINFLGEEVKDSNEVESIKKEYLELLRKMKENALNSCISVKPTQLGLSIDFQYCAENLIEIANAAKDAGSFVWLDMEGSKYTEDTVKLYESLLARNNEVGIAIQAYLKRSHVDIEALTIMGGKIRLVKGAYREPADIVYTSRDEIDANFVKLMEYLFENGDEFAIATHDEKIIQKAIEFNKRWNKKIEFQMLLGIRDELKQMLLKEGYEVASYIPYGRMWLPYSMRRLRERKRNILLIIRSLFGG